ncbi:hypothetical protein [Kitasatospora sp. NPDC007106]|uniref:hypothetical protein n=1 Tax=Kitasatospora sp. NPDC007106 TaxID=3156914 RepID=UPI0034078CA7
MPADRGGAFGILVCTAFRRFAMWFPPTRRAARRRSLLCAVAAGMLIVFHFVLCGTVTGPRSPS